MALHIVLGEHIYGMPHYMWYCIRVERVVTSPAHRFQRSNPENILVMLLIVVQHYHISSSLPCPCRCPCRSRCHRACHTSSSSSSNSRGSRQTSWLDLSQRPFGGAFGCRTVLRRAGREMVPPGALEAVQDEGNNVQEELLECLSTDLLKNVSTFIFEGACQKSTGDPQYRNIISIILFCLGCVFRPRFSWRYAA